ncbi:MAG: tRNA pseudouridine(54/55) synthase Pus10 [Candidatus Bathyarchaeota archaeon]|nr:MAG: tRNA pseudouridine(54/55) synthase Pus10 [Candidatus Bathyarchaeota archaeon]
MLDILGLTIALLEKHALCDHCLGRQFALLGHGLSNSDRGKALKLASILTASQLAQNNSQVGETILQSIADNGFSDIAQQTTQKLGLPTQNSEPKCYLCHGVFFRINDYVQTAINHLSQYDYESYLVGIQVDVAMEEREDLLRSNFSITWGESIRNELSREIGKRIQARTNKTVNLHRPDILLVINPTRETITVHLNSLFVLGRYRKLARGMPQSRWICNKCRGVGCSRCDWKGQLYPSSVEEYIASPLLELTQGTGSKLHAAGREDVDVRTLGEGRPFIVEIQEPRFRKIDLLKLKETINRKAKNQIEVNNLMFSSKEGVKNLKRGESSVKVYRAIVEFARELSDDELSQLERLNNQTISQFTPTRVMHRRERKTRTRYL